MCPDRAGPAWSRRHRLSRTASRSQDAERQVCWLPHVELFGSISVAAPFVAAVGQALGQRQLAGTTRARVVTRMGAERCGASMDSQAAALIAQWRLAATVPAPGATWRLEEGASDDGTMR